MSKAEKNVLSVIFIVILYFVTPSGADMNGVQWAHYIVGLVASVLFVWVK